MTTDLKRLTFPLLLLVGLNVLPGVWMRPLWSVIFCVVLLGYRIWLHLLDAKMPPRFVMLIGQITVAVAVWQHYFSFFGDEAAGTFLTLLTCLKAYELKTKRDYFITVLLCMLVLMSVLLIDQTLFMTLFLVADLILLMSYLFALEEGTWAWKGIKTTLRPAVVLTLKSLPLMAIVFVLFPRFSTGFGTGQKVTAKTGVTDALRPGSVANLIQSDELVFRATFLDGLVPPKNMLYWRGAVLDQANGIEWERSRTDRRARPSSPRADEEIEVYLEAGFERFLFSLEDTDAITFPKETRFSARAGRTFELDQPLATRQRYFLHRSLGRLTETEPPSAYIGVAEKPSKEMAELLGKLKSPSDAETVRNLLRHFEKEGYQYSLQPPPAASLDDFVFKTKTGFCEHFAGSMGTMLRYMDVPARVIVGFQGGTPSLLENYITIRAHDAHAWVEYYDRQANRWVRTDPTAPVDPLRISEGSQAYMKEAKNWAAWMPGDWSKVYERARALFDEVDANWTGFLLRFDLAKQKELLAKLGMEGVLFRALPVFLILAVVLILSILYYFEAQRREPLTPEESLYRLFLRALKRRKVERLPHEGPLQLMTRIESERPELSPKIRPVLAELVELRFGRQRLTPKLKSELRSQIRAL